MIKIAEDKRGDGFVLLSNGDGKAMVMLSTISYQKVSMGGVVATFNEREEYLTNLSLSSDGLGYVSAYDPTNPNRFSTLSPR